MAARTGKIAPQTQSSIAISGSPEESQSWWLVNASPDLAAQIERTAVLQPRDTVRNTPIAGVLLTNADLDHALGLLLLRQQDKPLLVYADEATRSALAWIDATLARFCGIQWCQIKPDFQPLTGCIAFRAIQLSHSVAFQFRDDASGRLGLVAPAVAKLSRELSDLVQESEVILFDGTFWSDGELAKIRPGARSARDMNHLPISEGSFDFLRRPPARRKIYTHINNTNPILMPGSPERMQVEQAEIEIARDGLEIFL